MEHNITQLVGFSKDVLNIQILLLIGLHSTGWCWCTFTVESREYIDQIIEAQRSARGGETWQHCNRSANTTRVNKSPCHMVSFPYFWGAFEKCIEYIEFFTHYNEPTRFTSEWVGDIND